MALTSSSGSRPKAARCISRSVCTIPGGRPFTSIEIEPLQRADNSGIWHVRGPATTVVVNHGLQVQAGKRPPPCGGPPTAQLSDLFISVLLDGLAQQPTGEKGSYGPLDLTPGY